ncbi:hypothetical protein QYF36_015385 [Acer negundo]|nr:hypothetical protein QYF36_015385 [Acer negundo]
MRMGGEMEYGKRGYIARLILRVMRPSSRKHLWILSRKPHLDEEIYNQLVEKAMSEGYDVSKLHKTPQSNSPPEVESAPQDTKGIWWIKSIFGK